MNGARPPTGGADVRSPQDLSSHTDGDEGESRLDSSRLPTVADLKAVLDMKSKKEIIEDGLDHRPSLEELKNRGLYQARGRRVASRAWLSFGAS